MVELKSAFVLDHLAPDDLFEFRNLSTSNKLQREARRKSRSREIARESKGENRINTRLFGVQILTKKLSP